MNTRALRALLVVAAAMVGAVSAEGAGVVGSGTQGSCTEGALDTALTGGGLVTFNCGPAPHVILLTAQKVLPPGVTTIRGAGLISLSGGNATRLFLVPTGASLICEDLVLRNGLAGPMAPQGAVGGAVLVDGGALALTRSTIRDSGTALTGTQTGGGIKNVNGAVTLTDSLIESNQSDSGGGIHTSGAAPSLTLVNTIVRSNRAQGAEGVGGGLDVVGAVTITGGRIEGNTAAHGAGLSVGAATVGVTDTIITNNAARLTRAGGIVNAGTLTLTNVILSDNTATTPLMTEEASAGLFNTATGVATLVGVVVRENRSPDETGGTAAIASLGQLAVHGSSVIDNPESVGIWVAGNGSATITDTTIAGGTFGLVACPGSLTVSRTTIADPGFAGLFVAGTATVENSTIGGGRLVSVFVGACAGEGQGTASFLNSTIAGDRETGRVFVLGAGRTVTFKNTIVAGTSEGPLCGVDEGGQIVSQGFNMASDDSCNLTATGDRPGTDPMLGPLQPNGGPTATHPLLPGSSAIDGGTGVGCPATDQRGFSRPRGASCDIGAFEFGVLVAAVGLNGSAFATGQSVTYEGTVNPGLTPTLVDIYFGAALPGLTTFLSFVEQAPGVVGIVAGPAPVPYQANVTAAPLTVPFQYTFGGLEPVGTYLTYAALVTAGANPFDAANQLSLDIRPFEFAP